MIFLKPLNAFFGIAFIVIGLFLPTFEFVHILQAPGEDAYCIIQGHWILTGVISVWAARSNRNSQLGASLVLMWAIVNIWLAGSALVGKHWSFLWVLSFPALTALNYIQMLQQDNVIDSDGQENSVDDELRDEHSVIPADYFEIHSTNGGGALLGILKIISSITLSIGFIVVFFFYIALIERIIFDGASVVIKNIPSALGGAFYSVLYIIIISAVVYSIVLVAQVFFEKLAIAGGQQTADDTNRALSLEERKFIEKNLYALEEHLESVKYSPFLAFVPWLSIAPMIVLMIGIPSLNVLLQSVFVNPVQLAGLSEETVISKLGPAYIGGVVFGGLFGTGLFWSCLQWLGQRYSSLGEYLHAKSGWNSMNNNPRSIHDYGKIFTRFVRLRRYSADQQIAPREFIFDAFNEHASLVYKSTIVLAVAMCLFTYLDINWRRIAHTGGLHYSGYLEFQSHSLTLSDVKSVKLRCFRFNKGDDGIAKLDTGYVLVFGNNMQMDLLTSEIEDALLNKVEYVDAELQHRDIPFERASRAGDYLFRDRPGFVEDCEDAVLTDYPPEISGRIWGLLNRE